MFSVVFVEPENPGNVGAVARSMKNFAFRELILVNPKCDPLSKEAKALAMHAKDILESARIRKDLSFLSEFDLVIGSTGILADKYSTERSTVSPKQLKSILKNSKGKKAILIGRESTGLSNDELSLCDIVVHIPTSRGYPVMNASHALTVILYEISDLEEGEEKLASPEMKQRLCKEFSELVDKLDFMKPEQVKAMFKRVIGRSAIRIKEASALIGFMVKVKDRL